MSSQNSNRAAGAAADRAHTAYMFSRSTGIAPSTRPIQSSQGPSRTSPPTSHSVENFPIQTLRSPLSPAQGSHPSPNQPSHGPLSQPSHRPLAPTSSQPNSPSTSSPRSTPANAPLSPTKTSSTVGALGGISSLRVLGGPRPPVTAPVVETRPAAMGVSLESPRPASAAVKMHQGRGKRCSQTSFETYEDIPVEEEEAEENFGMMLSEYISQMKTTPVGQGSMGLGEGGSHRPCSARPQSGRPQSGFPQSGRPQSGRVSSAHVGRQNCSVLSEMRSEGMSAADMCGSGELDESLIDQLSSPGSDVGPPQRTSNPRMGQEMAVSIWRDTSENKGYNDSDDSDTMIFPDEDPNYRGSARSSFPLAMSNALDLRPATAAVMQDTGRHGLDTLDMMSAQGMVREVDLGGLSSSLFTANADAALMSSGDIPSGGRMGLAERACSGSGTEPKRPSTVSSSGSVGGGSKGPSRYSSLHIRTNDAMGAVPVDELDPADVPSGGSSSYDVSPRDYSPSNLDGLGQARGGDSRAEAIGLHGAEVPPQEVPHAKRTIQSARPATDYDGPNLDPTVWAALITEQLQRPPSRQKPPPEALHLFPQQQFVPSPSVAQRPHRPQTAIGTTSNWRQTNVSASNKAQEFGVGGGLRPPSRQKPPPMSLDLDQHGERRGYYKRSVYKSDLKPIFTSDESDTENDL